MQSKSGFTFKDLLARNDCQFIARIIQAAKTKSIARICQANRLHVEKHNVFLLVAQAFLIVSLSIFNKN